MAGRHIHRQADVAPRFQAGAFDGGHGIGQQRGGVGRGRGQSAFIGPQGAHPVTSRGQFGGALINFVSHGKSLVHGLRGGRNDEDILDGDLPPGVFPAAEKIDGGAVWEPAQRLFVKNFRELLRKADADVFGGGWRARKAGQ